MKNQTFLELLERMKKIHEKKNADYASLGFYENFERCAVVADWFQDKEDKVFVTLITVKLARLATLLQENKVPNNESIEDTFLDLSTYSALWASRRKERQFPYLQKVNET